MRRTEGAYAICTLPLPVLRDLPIDVGPAMRQAIAAVSYASAGKIGLQFSRRFWEEDDGIFGGITGPICRSPRFLSVDRVSRAQGRGRRLLPERPAAAAMGELTPADALARALEQGAQIHPQYPREFEQAFSVAWQNVPFSRGGWAQWTEAQRRHEYRTLIEPDRHVYLCGDHLTYTVRLDDRGLRVGAPRGLGHPRAGVARSRRGHGGGGALTGRAGLNQQRERHGMAERANAPAVVRRRPCTRPVRG